MNIILDELPHSVVIDGSSYEIDTSFRTSILFEIMMFDDELNEQEKIAQALELYFGDNIPGNIQEAVNAIKAFYSCGREETKKTSKGSGSGAKKAFDFEYDADYIYSAFMHDYNIDLNTIDMHWWKFKALLNGLSEDNKLVKIMGYRSMDLSKITDKDEKARYKELQKIYAIPQPKEDIEKLDEINDILLHGGDLSKVL